MTPQWPEKNKNRDVNTRPLARPFARSLAPLTRSLAPDCSLRSHPPLRSLVRSLAHFAHSRGRGNVNFLMSQNDLVLSHSVMVDEMKKQARSGNKMCPPAVFP